MILLADSEGPDQTVPRHSLIWALAVCIYPKTCFHMAWPNSKQFSSGEEYVICLSEICSTSCCISYRVQKRGDDNESFHICRITFGQTNLLVQYVYKVIAYWLFTHQALIKPINVNSFSLPFYPTDWSNRINSVRKRSRAFLVNTQI